MATQYMLQRCFQFFNLSTETPQRSYFMNNSLKKSAQLLALLCSLGLIAGCGAERDEPFNPDTDEDETGEVIESTLIENGDQEDANQELPEDDKRLQVLKTSADFRNLLEFYSTANPTEPDFTDGQVILIDMGDTDSCEEHLTLRDVDAYETGNNGVKVVISYNEIAAKTSDCSSEFSRLYWFYHIESTGPLVFEEEIN